MASEEHKRLSQYIKEVHSTLRKSTLRLGEEQAWLKHCENANILTKYAQCMEKLATAHWENSSNDKPSDVKSRIVWTVDLCYDYFVKKTYLKYTQKEIDIAKKINVEITYCESFSEPLKLLDVGSCYNPFKIYDIFDVLAIDLCPANQSVYQCDFLNVSILSNNIISDNKVQELQQYSIDIVTFCFLLEYIPTSDLRIIACKKAYSLLKYGGLLIINTPDSKHVGANSKIMKCWRYALSLIGFSRIKYEKFKHMHCMAFRKSLHKEVACRWAKLHKESYMELAIHIPQDFNKDEDEYIIPFNKETIVDDFIELPFSNG